MQSLWRTLLTIPLHLIITLILRMETQRHGLLLTRMRSFRDKTKIWPSQNRRHKNRCSLSPHLQ